MQLDTPRKTRRTPRSAHALDLLVKATGVTMADPHRPLWLPEVHLISLCAKLSA